MDRACSVESRIFYSFLPLDPPVRSLALAALVTLLLLFAMSRLIATSYQAAAEPEPIPVRPIHIPEMKPTENIDRRPVRPELPPAQPPVSTIERAVDPTRLTTLPAPPGPGFDRGGPVAINRDPVPLYKPAPSYPSAALRRGLEGYVVVEFTISETGRVMAPRVVAGFDSAGNETRVFDRAALSAVSRFKYQPSMDDGRPVKRHGVRNRISFRLAD
ncbi:energy transducer TonB [Microbulbifer yueqingensis]|uniref:Protein TonB n=1 Tax=Microbulbifer yueqingensis TaxID=658219 RepID=A0A1G8YED5_9GAMM|nr:energy transducer TonB [Microbulbifer yueqingensis]SDK00575.1 outer membrane transport energization protein TonB [Microbulbifer yueqingensis]